MRSASIISLFCLMLSPVARAGDGAYGWPYSVEVVDEGGNTLPTFEHHGQTYVLGTLGQRYLLRVRNRSGSRIEVVASVDGRDVLDGQPASWSKRGYIVDPYGEMTVDGYRLNQASVAAFRFSSVSRSYASRLGDARDVGAIGVAVFTEHRPIYYPVPGPLRGQMDRRSDSTFGGEASGAAPPSAESKEAPDAASPNGSVASKDALLRERPGLGTEFGEQHGSRVYSVLFTRASSTPAAVLTLRYNDRPGLVALGIDVDRRDGYSSSDAWQRATAEPFRRNASFAQPPPGWPR